MKNKKEGFTFRVGLFLLLVTFCLGTVQAQSSKITGYVKDQSGEPLIGVNVMEKGTTNGTVTDLNGFYSIVVKASNAVLNFSYIGYKNQEISVAGKKLIDVTMKDDSETLDEVVVVGYGTMRKKDLTGSVVQVRPDKIANENPKTVQDILRGTPGLVVGYGEGDAGAKGGGEMKIRGQRSVYTDGGHNNPLIILDGMFFQGELSEINPDDIGQIDVLKDASAAAVYGAQAANGVIIITTKKGKKGKPVVNFTASVGLTQKAAYRDRWQTTDEYLQHYVDWKEKNTYGVNAETGEYAAYSRPGNEYTSKPEYFRNPNNLSDAVSLEQWRNYSTNREGESDLSIWARRLGFRYDTALLDNLLSGKTVDWQDEAFRLGFNQDYNVSISGAGDKVDYYMSLGYLRNEGAFVDDTYRAIRANLKLNAKVTNWFEVGANINFQDRSDGEIGMDKGGFMENSPYAMLKDENGNYTQDPLMYQYDRANETNWYFEKQYIQLEKGYTTLNTIFNAKVKLPFNITYQFNIAPRFQFFYDRYFTSAERPNSNPNDRGTNREQAKRFNWSLNNTITWDQTFANKHHVILTFVQEAEERQYWSDRIEARNILLGSVHLHADAGLVAGRPGAEALAGTPGPVEDIAVVEAAARHGGLVEAGVEVASQRLSGAEVHRRTVHGQDLARGAGLVVALEVVGSVNAELLAQHIAAAVEVEVGVVGQVDDGVLVGGHTVVHPQGVVRRKDIPHTDLQISGETVFARRAFGLHQKGVAEHLHIVNFAGEGAVQVIFAIVGFQLVGLAAERKFRIFNAVGVPAHKRTAAGAAG